MSRDTWRRGLSHVVIVLCGGAVLVALVPLALVLFYVVTQGVTALSVSAANRVAAASRVPAYSAA